MAQSCVNEAGCSVRSSKRDAFFVAALLLIAAVPLLMLERNEEAFAWPMRGASLIGFVVVGMLWAWTARRERLPKDPAHIIGESARRRVQWERAAVPILLFVLTWLVYFDPLRQHFWGGFDEWACLKKPEFRLYWLKSPGGRALLFYPMQELGQWLTPDRIDGFLWIGFALWFLNALLLKAILDRLYPENRLIGALAAVLLIANGAEPLRYFVMWSAHAYLRPLFWFLLSNWLLLVSHQRNARAPLVLSSLALAIALLTSEGLFPLTLVSLLLLWTQRRGARSFLTWAALWGGMVFILALRLALHLLAQGSRSYQSQQLLRGYRDAASLWNSLTTKASLILSYFEHVTFPVRGYRGFSAILATLVIGVVVLACRGRRRSLPAVSFRKLLAGLLLALIVLPLALAPFLHLVQNHRTQFFAAPVQAALIAIALVALCRFMPGKMRAVVPTLGAAVIVVCSAVHSYQKQFEPQPIHFAKTVRVFDQVHGIAPTLKPGTYVVFVLKNPQQSCLSYVNYPVCRTSRIVLGVDAGQINFKDPLREDVVLTPDGATRFDHPFKRHFAYRRMVAFQLRFDGTVSLLERLPQELVPENARIEEYDPLARMTTGPITPLRFLRHPSWLAQLPTILERKGGLMLGEGWGDIEYRVGRLERLVEGAATIYVNPRGYEQVDLEITLEASDGESIVQIGSGGSLISESIVGTRKMLRARVTACDDRPVKVSLTGRRTGDYPDSSTPARLRVLLIRAIPIKAD